MVTGELEDSRTKQEMAAACDINNIMKKFERTGEINHLSTKVAQYGDFGSAMSFQEARNAVIATTHTFEQLPHKIRTFFDNDPANLVDFMADSANDEAGREMGLYEALPSPEKPPAPVEVVVITPDPGEPVIAGGETAT